MKIYKYKCSIKRKFDRLWSNTTTELLTSNKRSSKFMSKASGLIFQIYFLGSQWELTWCQLTNNWLFFFCQKLVFSYHKKESVTNISETFGQRREFPNVLLSQIQPSFCKMVALVGYTVFILFLALPTSYSAKLAST